jgi:transposase
MKKPVRTREKFSREFKQEAVRLLNKGDKPASVLARELGIKRTQLNKWKEKLETLGDQAFPGAGRRGKQGEDEVTQLRRELERVKEENEILKKAAAFFARELK